MRVRTLAVTAGIATGVIVTTVFAQSLSSSSALNRSRYLPEYTAPADLIVPTSFHEWVSHHLSLVGNLGGGS